MSTDTETVNRFSRWFTNYGTGKRAVEISSLSVSIVLLILNGYYIVKFFAQSATLKQSIVCGIGGMLTADFLSGLVHWIADTWGTTDIPFIGEHLLKPFREHHIDPTAITRHDFVETNANNFSILIPFSLNMLRKFWTNSIEQIRSEYGWSLYLYLLVIFLAYTNQIHKWSHTYFNVPRMVLVLQKYRVILSRKQHRHHHVTPHDTYYCITTGWLNYPLECIHFWSTLERIVTRLTGCIPRYDDLAKLRHAQLEKEYKGIS